MAHGVGPRRASLNLFRLARPLLCFPGFSSDRTPIPTSFLLGRARDGSTRPGSTTATTYPRAGGVSALENPPMAGRGGPNAPRPAPSFPLAHGTRSDA